MPVLDLLTGLGFTLEDDLFGCSGRGSGLSPACQLLANPTERLSPLYRVAMANDDGLTVKKIPVNG